MALYEAVVLVTVEADSLEDAKAHLSDVLESLDGWSYLDGKGFDPHLRLLEEEGEK